MRHHCECNGCAGCNDMIKGPRQCPLPAWFKVGIQLLCGACTTIRKEQGFDAVKYATN